LEAATPAENDDMGMSVAGLGNVADEELLDAEVNSGRGWKVASSTSDEQIKPDMGERK
jgi:hypothetical protein